mgnify:CR=1 FL=1
MERAIRKEALFTSAPIGKAVAALALPTVLSQIITVIYNMADTYFVGQLNDPDQVAAATVAMPLFMLMTAQANLFGVGGSSLISRCLGLKNREKASRTAAFCIWTSAAVALVYGLLALALRPVLLPLFGANDATLQYSKAYVLWTVGVGAVPTVLSAELAHLVRAEGYSRQASLGIAFGGVLNMALDPLFIFVLRLGITGAAIATMLSNVAALCYFLLFLRKIRRESTITLSPKQYSLGEGIPGEVLAVGLPSFMISTMATFSNIMLTKIISADSNEAIAGMGIAKKIDLLAFAIAQGLTQGTLPLIGYSYTSGDRRRMLGVIRTLFFSCLLVSLSGAALLFWEATPITRLFIGNEKTVRFGRTYLRILSLACPTTALNFFCITVFQATGRKLRPVLLTALRKGGLDVPLMFVFDRLIGTAGVAWATPAADAAALVLAAFLLVPYLRRLKNGQA